MASILRRIAAGDPDAVRESIDRYGDLVWTIARHLLDDADAAEEAVPDVFVEIWRAAGEFDPKLASERVHVVMLARRELVARLRETGRPDATVPQEPLLRADRGGADDAEPRLAAEALRELPEERRRVLALAVQRGLGHRRIAEITDLSPETVKTHVTRGLGRVREALLSPEAGAD